MPVDPRGSWFRVYARQVRQHPKFHALSLHEMGGWLVLRAECELLDGNPITDRNEALLILRRHKATRPGALLDKLLEVRLLDVTEEGGYAIHDREDHDRPKPPSAAPEKVRERVAKHRAAKDVTNGNESVTTDVTSGNVSARVRAEPAYESDSELAYKGGPDGDDPNNDPLTLICRLVGYWPKPADHAEYKVAVEEMGRRYGDEWTLEAIPQAYALLMPKGRVRHWDLKRRAELILGERARSEELSTRVADQERARVEREEIAARQSAQSEEERERASLIRRAVKLWTHNRPDEPVPTDFEELRTWLEQNGATA